MPIITKNIYAYGGTGANSGEIQKNSTKAMAQKLRDFFVDELNWVELTDIDSATPNSDMYVTVTPTYHDAFLSSVSALAFYITGSENPRKIYIKPFRNHFSTSVSSGYAWGSNSVPLEFCQWQYTTAIQGSVSTSTIQCSFSIFDSDYCTCVWTNYSPKSVFFYIKDAIDFFTTSSNNLLIEGAVYGSTYWITDSTADIHDASLSYNALDYNVSVVTPYKTLCDKTTQIISPYILLLCSNKIKYLLSNNYFYMKDTTTGKFYNILDDNNNNWLCLGIAPNILVKVKNNSAMEESSNNG